MCNFCGIKYDTNKSREIWRQKVETIAGGGYTELCRGIDENNKIYIIASGDDFSDCYYPKFCPECGRKL